MNQKKFTDTIPFFVVDRPMSLKLLDHCKIGEKKIKFGLMTHANTSKNFQQHFKKFLDNNDNIVKACDSGVFTKNGCLMDYQELFSIYDQMGVKYGIMIDFLNDKKKTIESAELAIDEYKSSKYHFELMGVAQGRNIKEYLECYHDLKDLKIEHIAVGGLLQKNINSARYVNVKSEIFLKDVLTKIREKHEKDWLFALGCYHPKRHKFFRELEIFGSDSKGWILNYKTPAEMERNAKKRLNDINSEIEILNNKKHDEKVDIKKDLHALKLEKKAKLKLIKKIKIMNDDEKRIYRFKQIEAYFYKHIFSLFKDNLLIISCSDRKRDIDNPAAAAKIYDGPYYKMIRKMFREGKKFENLHIMIVSSKYGLLCPYDLIEKYDQKIREDNITDNCKLNRQLNEFLKCRDFDEILVSMGKPYYASIKDTVSLNNHKFVEGRIGIKLSKTKKWMISKSM